MTSSVLIVLGSVLIGAILVDVVESTLATTGGGPISMVGVRGAWRALLALHSRRKSHGALKRAAPLLCGLVIGIWTFGLWAGWAMIFSGAPNAVLDATTHQPAGTLDRLYFAGFSLITLGTGDFVGGAPSWRLASALCAFSGFFVVTLSLTYVLSVVSAATEKRQLARLIHGLGTDSVSILQHAWNGRDLHDLDEALAQIAEKMLLHAERHLAYPIIHFFHQPERRASLALSVAALDDALRLVAHGLPVDAGPNPVNLRLARTAVDTLLEHASQGAAATAPPLPKLEPLREAGLPLREASIEEAFSRAEQRRRRLADYVQGQGHRWEA